MPRPDPKAVFYLRVVLVTLILFAPGSWFIATRSAHFTLGGDENNSRRGIRVHADGAEAVLVGLAFYGVGLLGLAEAAPRRGRLPAFYGGAALVVVGLVGWAVSCARGGLAGS